ncbi:MAG: DNA-methyltransferase [Phycisphaerales bacterium]
MGSESPLVDPLSMHIRSADWLSLADALPRASIDLLYADPPFNTGQTQSDRSGRFEDRFDSPATYAAWLRERLSATLPALKPTANILIHVDWRTSHRVRLLLDDLLGPDRFVNHLVWSYGLGGSSPRRFARKHDDILFYCVHPDLYWFDPPMVPATSNRLRGRLKKATDVLDIPTINNMAAERVGYPTQKPLALLDLLVRACCPPGGTVLDPCCGSGTTLVAAAAAGRVAVGCDTNPDAVRIARVRLARARPAVPAGPE